MHVTDRIKRTKCARKGCVACGDIFPQDFSPFETVLG